MPATQVSGKFAALTADGTDGGIANIGDNAEWLPGAIAQLTSDTAPTLMVKIVEQVGSDKVRVRDVTQAAQSPGAFTDISAYTAADHSALAMEQQVVAVRQAFSARPVA